MFISTPYVTGGLPLTLTSPASFDKLRTSGRGGTVYKSLLISLNEREKDGAGFLLARE
jgi:hypothetical protein